MTVDQVFLDTNVLVYAHDVQEPLKQSTAESVLQELFQVGRPVASTQVLSELYSALTTKLGIKRNKIDAHSELRRINALCRIQPMTWGIIDRALDILTRHSISLWDAQIISAAQDTGCKVVLSEDMQDRQTIGNVTVINPFSDSFQLSELLLPKGLE